MNKINVILLGLISIAVQIIALTALYTYVISPLFNLPNIEPWQMLCIWLFIRIMFPGPSPQSPTYMPIVYNPEMFKKDKNENKE